MKCKRILALLLAAICLAAALCSCDIERLLDENGVEFEADLIVHYMDVGQGDAIFIELPSGKTMLIDSGENYHGAGILSYIQERGYNKLDYVVGTHPHADHIGSMAYIIRNFKIGSVYLPKVSANTKMYEELLNTIKKKNLTVKNARAGIRMVRDTENELAVRVIAPLTIDKENLNNSSAVIALDYKDATFLFTGDAEKEELESIQANVTADVLKVGHHGSSNANPEDFLKSVNPQIAVISCGADNDYGHPHASTLQALRRLDCDVYRTDIDKTVIIYSDGEHLSVETGGKSITKEKS